MNSTPGHTSKPLLILAVAFFCYAAGYAWADSFDPRYNPIRIMPLGDSITLGAGDPDREGYRRKLYRDLVRKGYDINFVGNYSDPSVETEAFDKDHQGTGGQTKEKLATNISAYINSNPAEIYLLHIGTNNPNTNANPVATILDAIKNDNVKSKVIVAKIINKYDENGTNSPIPEVNIYNTNVENMVIARNDANLSIVDMERKVLYPANYTDNSHPNKSGYSVMSDAWLESLLYLLPEPQGITSFWKMDESHGGVYIDSKFLNHGTCTGCPVTVSGIVDDGQLFSSGTSIHIAEDSTYNWITNDNFSIELWFSKDRHSTDKEVLLAWSLDEYNHGIIIGTDKVNNSEHLFFTVNDQHGETTFISSKPIILNEWHHVVLVRNSPQNLWKLFVDGSVEGRSGTFTRSGESYPSISIGAKNSNGNQMYQFFGIIDEVALYNRAVSEDEIIQHYQNGLSGKDLYYSGSTLPYIRPIENVALRVGDTFAQTIQAVCRPEPEYSLIEGPVGMTVHRTSGQIEWKAVEPGNVSVEVGARNPEGLVTRTFTMTVSPGDTNGTNPPDPNPSNGSGGGGGCVLAASSTAGVEWFLLFALLLLMFKRPSLKQGRS